MADFPEIPNDLLYRRDLYCTRDDKTVASEKPGIGLEAVVWPAAKQNILKVHRLPNTFKNERQVYQRLDATNTQRLKGFSIPQRLHYDAEPLVVELSFVFPPYILDFGAARVIPRPSDFDLDRIEAEFARQHGADWPDIRRLLEALMQLGVYYSDAHDQNIRPR
ncbi:MAG: hypothetical protein R3C59_07995 [Planctomycetaceae bacterium]